MALSTFVLAVLVMSGAAALGRELAGDGAAAAAAADVAMASRHEKWMAKHGKTYKDEEEKARRLEVFRANAKLIDSFNAAAEKDGGGGHRLATNRFADLTDDEFRAARTGYQRPPAAVAGAGGGFLYENFSLAAAPQSMDWRAMGAVTGVKDQGSCGTNSGEHEQTNDYLILHASTGNYVIESNNHLIKFAIN